MDGLVSPTDIPRELAPILADPALKGAVIPGLAALVSGLLARASASIRRSVRSMAFPGPLSLPRPRSTLPALPVGSSFLPGSGPVATAPATPPLGRHAPCTTLRAPREAQPS